MRKKILRTLTKPKAVGQQITLPVLPHPCIHDLPPFLYSAQDGRWADWNFITSNATLSKMPTVGYRGSQQSGRENATALFPAAEGFYWE